MTAPLKCVTEGLPLLSYWRDSLNDPPGSVLAGQLAQQFEALLRRVRIRILQRYGVAQRIVKGPGTANPSGFFSNIFTECMLEREYVRVRNDLGVLRAELVGQIPRS